MKKGDFLVCFGVLFLGIAVSASPVFADCRWHSKGGTLEGKFFHKAHSLMQHQDEIGLSEEQIESVKMQKREVKKTMLMRNAEIEILAVDINAKLREYPVDEKALSDLVSQKADLEKERAVAMVKAFAQLKNTMTEDQYMAMKEIWKEQRKS